MKAIILAVALALAVMPASAEGSYPLHSTWAFLKALEDGNRDKTENWFGAGLARGYAGAFADGAYKIGVYCPPGGYTLSEYYRALASALRKRKQDTAFMSQHPYETMRQTVKTIWPCPVDKPQ